jgi:ABC-type polysaccharide/polyol phosphate export permease
MGIYPLRTMLAAAFHLGIALVVVAFGNSLFNGFHPGSLLAVLPALPILLLFGWSVAVMTGFTNVYFPDAQHLTDVSMQMMFYVTPVMYTPEMLHKRGLGWLADYNPLAALIEIVRSPLLGKGPAEPLAYAVAGGVALFAFAAASLTLHRFERKVIFQL